MVRIAVTGASGMLGSAVIAAGGNAVVGYTRGGLDITNRPRVREVLERDRPDVVINCAGLTKHRDPEPTVEEYHRVNTYGPLVLATECDRIGARLIHVSTDCVFSGARPIEDGPYTEADEPDATDDYGRSKADGEIRGAPHLTVRCSFVGNGERGLIAWLRNDPMHDDEPLVLWERAYWSGSTAPAIARALVELAGKREVTGVMHLTRGVRYSKGELIDAIWQARIAPVMPNVWVNTPRVNRWLATNRTDVPALPPLFDALKELRG